MIIHKVVWNVREQVADLARYYDSPSLHAEMLGKALEAIDELLALLVTEDPVPGADMAAAKQLVVVSLLALWLLVDFPEAREAHQWMESLAEVGLLLPGEEEPRPE